jgi:recombination protein RecR
LQPAPIERLAAAFARLPGVGPRTAQRLTYYVLSRPDDEARALAAALIEVKEKIGECRICFNLAEGDRCVICQDPRRDPTLLCVVEGPADILPIERTHEYRGRYHVLGGALSPVDGVGPRDLHLAELYRRVTEGDPDLGEPGAPPTGPLMPTSGFGDDDADSGPFLEAGGPDAPGDGPAHRSPVQEVVVATNPTTSGEATALHIGAELREVAPHVTVSSTPTRSPSVARSPAAARSDVRSRRRGVAAGRASDGRPFRARSLARPSWDRR